MPTGKEEFNFTKAYQELEEINKWFQEEDIDLDEGLKKFRRGLELIKQCRERLKKVENQFQEIKKEFSTKELINKNKDEIKPEDLPF